MLHLWQAVQVVIDLAVSVCVRLGIGSPDDLRRVHAIASSGPADLLAFLGSPRDLPT